MARLKTISARSTVIFKSPADQHPSSIACGHFLEKSKKELHTSNNFEAGNEEIRWRIKMEIPVLGRLAIESDPHGRWRCEEVGQVIVRFLLLLLVLQAKVALYYIFYS